MLGKSAILSVLVLVAMGITAPANAQEFGRSGDVSFGADRLMGLYLWDNESFGDEDFEAGIGMPPAFPFPYVTPRLGIDFFVIDHLSIGGAVGLLFGDDDGPGDDDDFGFMIAPRVGYAINFDDTWGFWPRGGFTISDGNRFFNDDEFALTIEAPFFVTPVEHFGFNFGPTLDIGLFGDGPETVSLGFVTGGVFGWL